MIFDGKKKKKPTTSKTNNEIHNIKKRISKKIEFIFMQLYHNNKPSNKPRRRIKKTYKAA